MQLLYPGAAYQDTVLVPWQQIHQQSPNTLLLYITMQHTP